MARFKGKDGAIEVGGTPVGEVESFDVEFTINEIDANVMGSDWTDVVGGQKSVSGSLSVLTDNGDAQQTSLVEGATVALTLFPIGDTTGLIELAGNAMITSVSFSTSVGDLVKTSINFRNQGAWTNGTVV